MPENSIIWKSPVCEAYEENVSEDERWHVSRKQSGTEKPEIYLSNYDLLLTPVGIGCSIEECFEKFIKACDRYTERLTKIRDAAQTELDALRENEILK